VDDSEFFGEGRPLTEQEIAESTARRIKHRAKVAAEIEEVTGGVPVPNKPIMTSGGVYAFFSDYGEGGGYVYVSGLFWGKA